MVLQIAADAGPVGDHLDAVFPEMRGRADARQHQELRRIDRRGGDDHFASRLNDLNLFASFDLDADGALILDDHPPREAVDQAHIFPLQRGPQIGVGRRPAAAAVDGLLHRPEAFLLGAVVVVGQLEAGLAARFDKGGVERVACAGPRCTCSGPLVAAPAVLAAVGVLHALEVGEHVGKAPAGRALLRPSGRSRGHGRAHRPCR